MAKNYPLEHGEISIHGVRMGWSMRRSKGESAFGIQGSRIFYLEMRRNGKEIAKYDRAWETPIPNEDEEAALTLQYLIDKYGRNKGANKPKEV